ncbi:hypothetical protein [Hydrogenovibrio marinus]|uniref:Uncharacterized protein n=1 Tax=Hydrogenovibrio marinus TaxID=28885 RepID=A0A066ZXJ6_HYDMR|nr:hypothetical protein [Hydrogenovibrio marinus]KDN94825.1 hypothetical protein EI16_00480 [Hydrogenovibrio marinus]BBN59284.1 hypothetical protein HVMH_0878 [Hydrogenovibrio marinus]
MQLVEAVIRKDGIQLTIPTDYLKRQFFAGVTTNDRAIITDENDMLHYFCKQFENFDDDAKFGRFIDSVCSEAINNGETFLEPVEE